MTVPNRDSREEGGLGKTDAEPSEDEVHVGRFGHAQVAGGDRGWGTGRKACSGDSDLGVTYRRESVCTGMGLLD